MLTFEKALLDESLLSYLESLVRHVASDSKESLLKDLKNISVFATNYMTCNDAIYLLLCLFRGERFKKPLNDLLWAGRKGFLTAPWWKATAEKFGDFVFTNAEFDPLVKLFNERCKKI